MIKTSHIDNDTLTFGYQGHYEYFPDLMESDRLSSAPIQRKPMYDRTKNFFSLRAMRELAFDSAFKHLSTYPSSPESNIASTSYRFADNISNRFIANHLDTFIEFIEKDRFEDSFTDWFETLFQEYPESCRQIIQKAYYQTLVQGNKENNCICNILGLMAQFSYDEMVPIGVIIASSATAIDSDAVKSKALDLIGHWGNRQAYNLLMKITPPDGFLAKKKYEALLNTFNRIHAIHSQNN